MRFLSKTKAPILFLGDIAFFYAGLILTLYIRYRTLDPLTLQNHLVPFTWALALWLIAFYIGGLYESRSLKNDERFEQRFFGLLFVGGALMAALFYFVPAFGIAPKANLFIFVGVFGILGFSWRTIFNLLLSTRLPKNRLLLLGSNRSMEEFETHLREHPELGYETAMWMRDGLQNKDAEDLRQILRENRISLIVVPGHIKKDKTALRTIYHSLIMGIDVVDLADIYEATFKRVSLPELEEGWIIEKLPGENAQYQKIKHGIEAIIALILLIVLSPIFLILFLLIPLTSEGAAIYRQKRVGRSGNIFELYKFRSMYAERHLNPDADSTKPVWTASANDRRITPLGKFLRSTHLDELPQLYNILRGQMSFIGPRPERPEFTRQLEKEIPFYELRHLINPGIAGWAQLNYPYGASIEDAYEKLQYEIYYLKNRSAFMDLEIFLKTIKRFIFKARR